MKPVLHIWLYNISEEIQSHQGVYENISKLEVIHTYDTSFFKVGLTDDIFENIIIHWKDKVGLTYETSVNELLENKCIFVDKEIRRAHNLEKIFWGSIYTQFNKS